ncbi:unnamed protein product (macronuclear) [Paramecium tetraurelia]|uniref:HSF-type DNA-binding domain-containing protein n=1 Tax=Paramecium tetraurelia TaxID=5888 RepID=A0C9N9_PARTE|nr:uncharacterized protein GSPATT00006812001 [Paramecium tetraurelia]CAK67506.1 unnamed protein product [Paramecium tetraurelia]|eukprot:XP_001434903.1 hypothetical protein (macronuclear) [Paramecium tetraurelia strain d4-2]
MNTKNQRIPKFVTKLIEILDNQSYQEIISFDQKGDGIIIHQQELFENQILLNYFKHNHIDSFTRQMNNYGFKRVKNHQGKYEFKNPYFQKNNKYSFYNIALRNLIHLVMKKKQEKIKIISQFLALKSELNSFSKELDQFNFFASSYQQSQSILTESQNKAKLEMISISQKNLELEKMLNSLINEKKLY